MTQVKRAIEVEADSLSIVRPGETIDDGLGTEVTSDELDELIHKHVKYLEAWATASDRSARWDRGLFWLSKLVVLMGAGGTSVLAIYELNSFATTAAMISTLFTTLESVRPRGVLYRVHTRAANDLRQLQSLVLTRWDQIRLQHPKPESPERRKSVIDLLEEILKAKRVIGETLAQTEAQLGGSGSSGASFSFPGR